MGINIGISIEDSPRAPCRGLRRSVVKVHVEDIGGLEDAVIYDTVVDLDEARKAVGDWDAFLKRNRISADTDAVYMEKVKKQADRDVLLPVSKKVCTGWVDMASASPEQRALAMSRASEDDMQTEWDLLELDEMADMCAGCPLSWDKGRGCIGVFGPGNSRLPEIASKYGCPIVASVPESVKSGKVFGPEDAEELLREVGVLEEALPGEGKKMVQWYSGPVERMRDVANVSVSEKCGFYFF